VVAVVVVVEPTMVLVEVLVDIELPQHHLPDHSPRQ
jgi:hypothetical protein